jgi:hypothetical protein
MDKSMKRTGRAFRVKTVIVGLVFATLVAGVGIAARMESRDGASAAAQSKNIHGWIIRASQPLASSGQPPAVW